MSGWKLPTSVTVCGQEFAIRSDYRAVLDAISALRDPELSPQEQTLMPSRTPTLALVLSAPTGQSSFGATAP